MSSKKEEERNEKVIRGLLKLPPNRRCINCNSLGPQYVCTNFWTFVCITCSGIHREFTHRVKSVSMAKFTSQEVDALQKGGNQRARESYLKDYDPMQQKFPDSRNVDKIREFIKSVYVDKKFAGAKNSERPPRDLQNDKKYIEEDHRRASSYHSYSQSPPYDFQYEDRINGTKQNAMLTRKPGSDRGRYEGKLASFLSCPINSQEFENRIPGSRVSDFLDSNVDNIRNRSFDSISIKSADSNNDTSDEPIMHNNPTITSNSNLDLFSQAKTQISENTGWATFESSPVKPASQTDDFGSKIEKFAPLTDLFPADFNDAKLSSNDNTNDSQAWNAFEDLSIEEPFAATTNISQDWFSFEDTNLNEKSTQPNTVVDTSANNPFACDEVSEVSNEDWTEKLSMDNLNLLNCGNPFDSLTLTLAESNILREDKTSSSNNNPFDLPFDPHSEALDMSMEMGPLEKSLPDFQIPDAFLDALFPSQAPSSPFRNIVPPTAITSGSGNPFA